MKKNIFLITFSICLFSGILSGQDFDSIRLNNILRSLKLDKTKIKEELCTEKKMPNAEDSYIAVIPVIIGQENEDYIFTVHNYILITDSNGTIKNKYLDSTDIDSDAVSLRSFTIDTGLYTIGTDIRAFGVKADFVGSSRPNPYGLGTISLYYPESKTFRKVLDQFTMNLFSGEWDTRCNGEFEDDHSYIVVEKSKTNNFADLKIKTISVATINKDVKGECESKETSKASYKTLKFKNGKYQ
ncbi:PA3715 family protein [Chryseobacterium sp. M5A1_1a]